MQKMGQAPTEEELDAMLNAADADKDGKIDFKGILWKRPCFTSYRVYDNCPS